MSAVTFARIYSETMNQLARHSGRVKLGRDVDAAKSFANWLFWSGIPALLKENSTPPETPAPLKCDGAHLAWQLNELIEACNDYYRTNKAAGLGSVELQSLEEKVDRLAHNLDLIAAHLAHTLPLSSPSSPIPATETARFVWSAPACPPGLSGGVGAEPSLSKCHNSTEEKIEKPHSVQASIAYFSNGE
jgi:hypothetical protein